MRWFVLGGLLMFWRFFLVGCVVVGLVLISNAQEDKSEDFERTKKANEIVKYAHNVVYKKSKTKKLSSIWLTKSIVTDTNLKTFFKESSKPQEAKTRTKGDKEVLLNFPNKVKSISTTYISKNNPAENFTKMELVQAGDLVKVNQLSIFNGKVFDIEEIAKQAGNSEESKSQIKALKEARRKMETKEFVRQSVWFDLFPILLKLPWESEAKFIYLGKAQAGNTRADILEYVPSEEDKAKLKKEKMTSQMRFFFDEKTHLLLMVTADISSEKSEIKTKYFFSDYQTMDGLLIAKRINSETTTKIKQETTIAGRKMIGSETKIVSETIVKKFKINPKFKKGTFEIKK